MNYTPADTVLEAGNKGTTSRAIEVTLMFDRRRAHPTPPGCIGLFNVVKWHCLPAVAPLMEKSPFYPSATNF